MKLPLFIFALATAAALPAADLNLADGRTFKDYRIIGQTATTVMVRHPGGAAKVAKSQLPADVLQAYPIDEAIAASEAEATARRRETYAEQTRALEEKRAAAQAARIATNIQEAEQQARHYAAAQVAETRVDEGLAERIEKAVKARAKEYFTLEQRTGNSALQLEIKTTLHEPTIVANWPGRYSVIGSGYAQRYDSRGRSFTTSEKVWFEATVETARGLRVTAFARLSSPPLL